MGVRILNQQELLTALHLVWGVYEKEELPKRTPEEIQQFRQFIQYENMSAMYERGELRFYGAFVEGTELVGVLALDAEGRTRLFCVRQEWKGTGIEQQLYETARKSAVKGPKENQKSKAPLIIAIVAGAVLVFGVTLFTVVRYFTGATGQYEEPFDNREDEYDGYGGYGEYDEGDASESSGLDDIQSYEAKGLTYEVRHEEYAFSDKEKRNIAIDFSVYYPQIDGLDESIASKVNEELKSCAMETMDQIYTNPSEEIKERVLKEDVPALISYVDYKVAYINQDIVSVVYEDYSCQGSADDSLVNLRTRNISLRDGTIYEVKDIVDLSDEFLGEWVEEMKDEADNDKFLAELSAEERKKALSGQDETGVYVPNFFLDADGIQIGFDLNYQQSDANDLGYAWVTAPFSMDDIQKYQTKSEFWKCVD